MVDHKEDDKNEWENLECDEKVYIEALSCSVMNT